MEKELKALLEKAILNDETKAAIVEAWTNKVTMVEEETAARMRDEFASRYEHDKKSLIEGLDSYVTEKLQIELKGLVEERKLLSDERKALAEKANSVLVGFDSYIQEKITEELTELNKDRAKLTESIKKAESFIVEKLTEEMSEYKALKQSLVEERVMLETSKQKEINEAKARFIKQAAITAEQFITESMKKEFATLKTQLAEARKFMFGQKLFEAFALEYNSKFFNESTLVKSVSAKVDALEKKLNESEKVATEAKMKLAEAEKKVRLTKDLMERKETLNNLLSSLDHEKRNVMNRLLESVATPMLRENFKKFLPSVLKETGVKRSLNEGQSEMKIIDGNRKVVIEQEAAFDELKRLSAIN